jgi:hypothetical protein
VGGVVGLAREKKVYKMCVFSLTFDGVYVIFSSRTDHKGGLKRCYNEAKQVRYDRGCGLEIFVRMRVCF